MAELLALITLPRVDVIARIGRLSEQDWAEVQSRLRLSIAVQESVREACRGSS